MDDDHKELLKVGAEAVMKPFAALMDKLFGGAFEEIGLGLKNKLSVRRQIREIKLFKKLQAAIDGAAFEPRTIPDDIGVPALEAAFLIDDDYLLNTWANLLANAADSRHGGIEPLFVRILSELSSREVNFLDALSKHRLIVRGLDTAELQKIYLDTGLALKPTPEPVAHFSEQAILHEEDKTQFSIMMDILSSVRIVMETRSQQIVFSGLGLAFLRACQPPPKS
jgi:hypothetical protein